MTRRTRLLFVVLGIVTLAAAIGIVVGLRTGAITSTDDTIDVELIAPAGA